MSWDLRSGKLESDVETEHNIDPNDFSKFKIFI